MNARWMILLVLLTAILTGTLSAYAQTEEDKIRAVIDSLREAIRTANAEEMGKLVSDSGFVGVLGAMGETMVVNKQELLALFANASTDVEFTDIEISTHWTVALLSGKAVPAGAPPEDAFTFDGILVREAGQWKLVALFVCEKAAEATEDQVKAFVDRVAALPDSLREGVTDDLERALHDERLIIAFVDPAFEYRWANSKNTFVQMVQSVIPMIAISKSELEVEKTVIGDTVAAIQGNWLLDITDFGETNSTIHAYAVKIGDEWKVVAIGGGPAK
ncbi:MAG: nuclear transport factor 2 family protein [Candidatus Zipacnadales bacterium]